MDWLTVTDGEYKEPYYQVQFGIKDRMLYIHISDLHKYRETTFFLPTFISRKKLVNPAHLLEYYKYIRFAYGRINDKQIFASYALQASKYPTCGITSAGKRCIKGSIAILDRGVSYIAPNIKELSSDQLEIAHKYTRN